MESLSPALSPYVAPGIYNRGPSITKRDLQVLYFPATDQEISIRLINVILGVTGVHYDNILRMHGVQNICMSRFLIMYYLSSLMDLKLKDVICLVRGPQYKAMHHSTVINGRELIVSILKSTIPGDYEDKVRDYVIQIDIHLKQLIDENLGAYRKSR